MSYIIKAEINGIQEFIFTIQSKGAAKALKARSFMVDAACILMEEIFKDVFPQIKQIFNGGGNVYLEVENSYWDENKFIGTAQNIAKQLLSHQMTISLTSNLYDGISSFGDFIKKLNEKLNKEKLRFGINDLSIFLPARDNFKLQTDFKDFTKTYSENSATEISDATEGSGKIITPEYIQILNKKLTLKNKGARTLLPLPVWTKPLTEKFEKLFEKLKNSDPAYQKPKTGDIISFEELAAFAKERTGTDNIGVLKLDIDNLGKLFQKLQKREDNEFLSKELKDFFSVDIIKLLEEKVSFGEHSIKFEDNIYTVYAGGDDCFFIGAWDAVIEFAVQLQKKFSRFESDIVRKKLTVLKNPITVSASIIIVDSHFPVVRFAEIAGEDLKAAKAVKQNEKKDASDQPMKNNISFMGYVFSWDEFYEMERVKNTLHKMISVKEESKAFLQRIINAFENKDTIYWHSCDPVKPFNPAILWRFLYSFRDVIKKSYFINEGYNEIFFSRTDGYYKKYVWQQFSPGKELSQVMPVAARWTELLNRKQNQ
ncbi:MAG: hypothetical protein ABI675_04270 [Chitinophagaceae bacterium]